MLLRLFSIIAKLEKTKIGRKRGLMFDERMPIGYGLYISHGFGIVVNPTAVIGNNVVLSQFSTIGANLGKAAVIKDFAFVGPSVCIVENVNIGEHSVIGAGAVVVKDVEPHSTYAGVPAKKLSNTNSDNYILNPFRFNYKK